MQARTRSIIHALSPAEARRVAGGATIAQTNVLESDGAYAVDPNDLGYDADLGTTAEPTTDPGVHDAPMDEGHIDTANTSNGPTADAHIDAELHVDAEPHVDAELHIDAELHVDAEPHVDSDAYVDAAHPDPMHGETDAHANPSSSPAPHDGVVSVDTHQDGVTVTHFADGSSATTDAAGNLVSFTEPHHDTSSMSEKTATDGGPHPNDAHGTEGGQHETGTGVDASHSTLANDAPSPASLQQNPDVADCFVVATLNEIAARPGGMDYLRSLVSDHGDGTFAVTLQTPNGPETIIVANNGLGASTVGPSSADGTILQVIEAGIGAARSEGYGGNHPDDGLQSIARGGFSDTVYTQLGLQDVHSNAPESGWIHQQDAPSIDPNAVLDHINAGDPVVLATFAADDPTYGLVAGHQYSVAAVITDELGIPAVVFHDPYGADTKPIPITALDDVGTYTWGTIPSASGTDLGGAGPNGGADLTDHSGETATTTDAGVDTTDTFTYGSGDVYGGPNVDAGFDGGDGAWSMVGGYF